MFVDAIREPLTEEEVAALRPGDMANVDSGLGASFSVEFTGHDAATFHFQITSPEFKHWGGYRFTFDEVRQKVYQIVARDPYFRTLTAKNSS